MCSSQAFADNRSYTAQLIEQKTKIDDEITARNKLLDRLHIKPMSEETNLLASINSYETTVEYLLDAANSAMSLTLGHEAKDKAVQREQLANLSSALTNACTAQKMEMLFTNEQMPNVPVKEEVIKQIENVRTACFLLSSLPTKLTN
jgi:hypothetical protein